MAGIPSVLNLKGNVQSDGAGVGDTYNGIIFNNEAHAFIDDGAVVKAKQDVAVTADTYNLLVNVGAAGAAAKNFGVSGTAGDKVFDNQALAYIEDTASVMAGHDVRVAAAHDVLSVLAAGALVKGEDLASGVDGVGVGASLSLNELTNDTEAFIGNKNTSAAFK